MTDKLTKWALAIPVATVVVAAVALSFWWNQRTDQYVQRREPGTDLPPGTESATTNPIAAGKLIHGDGQPADLPGAWPAFRGANRDNISTETTALARAWQPDGPRELWATDAGEGYAGAVVLKGRVYVMDYDQAKKQDALRCLSLADGREIWRYAYPVSVKRNHGMSRALPAVTDKFAVGIGPKCHVLCLDAASGQLRWGMNLVREFGGTVPPWYNGQCPLIDNGAVILAAGGRDILMVAVELETGKVLWQSPNPRGWKMTHSSIMPMEFGGQRCYVYCASGGVVGVSAKDGSILWDTPAWKISIATIASPLVLGEGKIFLSGGYNAGSLMLQLKEQSGKIVPETAFKLAPEVFGATQHTPIFHAGHIYGVRPDGQFVCLDLSGKVVWSSGAGTQFGLGPFLLANGLIYALNDSGKLSVFETTTARFNLLGQAQVLKGHESWGPMALAGGRLLVRDLTRLACLDVAGK